jgi:hypothetical protein
MHVTNKDSESIDQHHKWLEAEKEISAIWRPLWAWGDKLSVLQKSLIILTSSIIALLLCAIFFEAMIYPLLMACLYLAWNTVGTCRIIFSYFYGWNIEPTKKSGFFAILLGVAFLLLIHSGLRHIPLVGGKIDPIAVWEEK